MKTKEIVDKYQKLIAGLLKLAVPEHVKFKVLPEGDVLMTQTSASAGHKALVEMGHEPNGFTNWKTGNEVSYFMLKTKDCRLKVEDEPEFDGE